VELRSPGSRPASVAIALAIASPVLPGIGFVLNLALVPFVARLPPVIAVTPILAITAAPVCALGAIVAGHIARHRNSRDELARVALIVGYCELAGLVLLLGLAVMTWWTISTRSA
jgi:hypothetical protein